MREPYVVPRAESPFAFDVSAEERRARRYAHDADVLTDESGICVGFRGEEDVEALLNDPRFGAIAMATLEMSGVADGPLHDLWSLLMFGKDGDEHKRLRGAVAREFTPRAVRRYQHEIEGYATDLAQQMADAREVELWSSFALQLAASAACRVVGIPIGDRDRVAQWAIDLVNAFFFMDSERSERAERAAVEFTTYLDGLIAAKRSAPGDDVTSRLVAEDAAHDLSSDECRAMVANLVFGGLEATAKATTTGVFHLLDQGHWRELAERPEIADRAVAELLRFEPPTDVARLAGDDLVCRDVRLRAGQLAMLDLHRACRDPKRHSDPDSLDLTRDVGRQLAFGAGPHFCLGANLAKLVLEIAFRTLATRFPGLRLVGAPDEVAWDYETFAGVVALPVATGE